MYEKLAEVFELVVNWDNQHGGQQVKPTFKILGRVFKTFKKINLCASAGTGKDIWPDQQALNKALSTAALGHWVEYCCFDGLTVNNTQVAVKYCLDNDPLQHEADTLKKLSEVKGILTLLYEDFNSMIPYIVTSMVGQRVTKTDVQTACNIIIDILEVLKSLHDHHYIHNDINPEALCYTVAFMHNQDKEYWHTTARDPFKALHKKEKFSEILHLFDNLPQVFQDFFHYVYKLNITAMPDYEYWHKKFTSTVNDLFLLSNRKCAHEIPLSEISEEKSSRQLQA
ncbi:2390_t:CDS:2 [Paraglomus brasilianum]|uniref:2390_t:CDS:1 n=1 Tax=Paraglomus brasilianum TaxID=144538 RepID=A0A9N9GNH4_9GLOM|nr:2390_t:CDS:2 [Paraglomus brasilianum]